MFPSTWETTTTSTLYWESCGAGDKYSWTTALKTHHPVQCTVDIKSSVKLSPCWPTLVLLYYPLHLTRTTLDRVGVVAKHINRMIFVQKSSIKIFEVRLSLENVKVCTAFFPNIYFFSKCLAMYQWSWQSSVWVTVFLPHKAGKLLETFIKQRILETILISTWSSTSGITPCVATRLKEKLQHIYASDQIFVEEPWCRIGDGVNKCQNL